MRLPLTEDLRSYARRRIHELLQKFLPQEKLTVLEVGCAPGRWLAYFHHCFGYQLAGVEYTKNGYEMTLANLQALSLSADIRHEDIFETSFRPESVDVVFSMGVVEHFTDPKMIVEAHLQPLKKGGWLVVGVPNIGSPFYGALQRRVFSREIYRAHVPVTRDWLIHELIRPDLERHFCDYVGTFNLFMLNASRSPRWLKWAQQTAAVVTNTMLLLFKPRRESPTFSPYIFYIGQKR